MASLEIIRKGLEDLSYESFFYQTDNYYNWVRPHAPLPSSDSFFSRCSMMEEALAKNDDCLWRKTPAPLGGAKPVPFKFLKDVTSKSSMGYLKTRTMHGKLFIGPDEDNQCSVAVKTWDFLFPWSQIYLDHPTRFCNELELLTREDLHPCLMRLKGFCYQHVLAVVYEQCPERFLSDSLGYGENFQWDDRMKVVTQLASLFTWLHDKLFTFGAVRPSGIMVGEDFKIKVFDFGFLGHLSKEDDRVPIQAPVFPDAPEAAFSDNKDGNTRNLKADVYIFGVLLVDLITKKQNTTMACHTWVWMKLKDGKTSIVDESLLQGNNELANSITKLAVECLDVDPNARPKMKDVSARLSALVNGAAQTKEEQD